MDMIDALYAEIMVKILMERIIFRTICGE